MSVKYMDLKEFREKGYLQEANRLFFHPLGLALEMTLEANGEIKLSGIWDYRDDEEGVMFAKGVISKEKIANISEQFASFIEARTKLLGSTIQDADS